MTYEHKELIKYGAILGGVWLVGAYIFRRSRLGEYYGGSTAGGKNPYYRDPSGRDYTKVDGQWRPDDGGPAPLKPTIVVEDPRNVAAGKSLYSGGQMIDKLLQSKGKSVNVQGGVAYPTHITQQAQGSPQGSAAPSASNLLVNFKNTGSTVRKATLPQKSNMTSTDLAMHRAAYRGSVYDATRSQSKPAVTGGSSNTPYPNPKNAWESCMNAQARGARILCTDAMKKNTTNVLKPPPMQTQARQPIPQPAQSAIEPSVQVIPQSNSTTYYVGNTPGATYGPTPQPQPSQKSTQSAPAVDLFTTPSVQMTYSQEDIEPSISPVSSIPLPESESETSNQVESKEESKSSTGALIAIGLTAALLMGS